MFKDLFIRMCMCLQEFVSTIHIQESAEESLRTNSVDQGDLVLRDTSASALECWNSRCATTIWLPYFFNYVCAYVHHVH